MKLTTDQRAAVFVAAGDIWSLAGGHLDPDQARALGRIADELCDQLEELAPSPVEMVSYGRESDYRSPGNLATGTETGRHAPSAPSGCVCVALAPGGVQRPVCPVHGGAAHK